MKTLRPGGVAVGPARGTSLRCSRRRRLLQWHLPLSVKGVLSDASATRPAVAPLGRRGASAGWRRLPREHHHSERPMLYPAAWGALASARSLARASRRTRRAGPPGGPSTAPLRIPAVGKPKGGSRVDAPRQGAPRLSPRYPPAWMQICSARARSSPPGATPTSTLLASASATRRAASSSRRKRRAISRRAARVTAQTKPAWVP